MAAAAAAAPTGASGCWILGFVLALIIIPGILIEWLSAESLMFNGNIYDEFCFFGFCSLAILWIFGSFFYGFI